MTTHRNSARAVSGALEVPPGIDDWDSSDIVRWVFEQYKRVSIAWSGADSVLVDVVCSSLPDTDGLNIFVIDTGFLNTETIQFVRTVEKRYQIEIEMLSPYIGCAGKDQPHASIFTDINKRLGCCREHKIAPLTSKLATVDAWMTGQRAYQNPVARSNIPIMQLDPQFSTEAHQLIKTNPIICWSKEQTDEYITERDLLIHPLTSQGYESIGCAPCTRPGSGRAGRWWWESESDSKECGMHCSFH